jgi:hypothetical protein
MAEGRLPKIALKWKPKQRRARGRPKKNWMEGIKKAMNGRNLKEGQWEDRKQWSLGVEQRRKSFKTGDDDDDDFGNRKNDSVHNDEKYGDAIRVVALANISFV